MAASAMSLYHSEGAMSTDPLYPGLQAGSITH